MTNNDELAIKLKAAAEKALPAIQKYEAGEIDGDDALEMLSDFTDAIKPANILALLEERDADKKRIADMNEQLARYSMSPGEADQRRCESRAVRDALGFGKDSDNVAPADLLEQISALRLRIAELQTVSTAAEKLVRCKGRYHSEQNYRSLSALFGVKTPDLPPLETEARTVSVKIKPATIGRAYSALAHVWTVQEVREACSAAGIKLEVGE